MVFTAVLAAIAVIAAMVTVPGVKAEAAEPTDFTPNSTLGNELKKEEKDPQHFAADYSWGLLVWAGEPAGPGFNNGGNQKNDVGWAWCIEPHAKTPLNTFEAYEKKNATKLEFDGNYHDAVINLGRKMEAAAVRGDKEAAANYYVYLLMFLNSSQNPKYLAFETIVGNSKAYFPGFTGSHEEFTALTGYKIEGTEAKPQLVKDPTVEIAKQPADAYITVVHPNNNRNSGAQSVIPVDQPGLPDEPDDGGGSEEPTTSSEEEPSDVTTPENPGEETSPNETTENPEPSGSETTTPKDTTSETTPDKTTDVVPNPEPTPTTSEHQKDLEPKIETEASIKDGNRVEKGARVIDTVTFEDLVPGKHYTLKAKLVSKADGKTVLGEGSAEFVPEESAGKKDVEITVNDKADPAVDAAVAFEKLVSTEVDKGGNETTGSTDENVIATHEDINDEKQTVNTKWAPSIKTNADFDNAKQVKAGVTVKDTVTYTDLVPGKEYTLKAELRNKAENAEGEHDVVGKGEVTFTPKKSAGEQVVDIKVNDDVEGVIKAAVAFEDLYSKQVDENGKETPNSDEEKKITEHRDIDDEDQTVTSKQTPKISTNADFEDGSHEVVAGAKIVDEVSYEGLVPGKEYTLKAELISKADGETVLGKGEATFTPEKSEGKEPVTITVNDDVTEPVEAAVAFEELTSTAVDEFGEETPDASSDNPNEIAEHKDIDDEDQTVTSEDEPETSAPETTTPKEDVPGTPGGGDETCESEEPGNSESEKPSESEEPSSSESSEPSESESVETTSSEASETSESDEPSDCGSTTPEKPGEPSESTEPNEPGTPGDNDEKDTPKVSTNADFEGDLREVVAGAKVVDQVSYEGLVPGKQYTLDAQLISKEDGKTVLGETKGHKFTPASANGTEAVTIVVDEKVTEPVEAAVAFETLTSTQVDKHGEDKPADEDNPNPVGEHKDINDDDQTVTSEGSEKTPKITTNADFEKGSHAVIAGAKIVDEVTYEGLVPGKEYTLKAELINKKDGKSVLGTGEKTFTPEKSHGMVPVTITVNDDVKEPVQAAVAFEELTSIEVNDKGEETPGTTPEKPNHIAEHKDIDDDDQTVISHEVEDQDNPDDDTSNGGSSNGSSKDNKWWLILIPGIGLGKIIKDHFDHKDHGNHNGGHGDNTSSHNGGHGDNTGNHDGGNGHEVKGQDAPKGGNADNGHGRGVEVQGQEPEETGNALPSNAERVEIKSVPSGATELEPGMQDCIK